MWSNGAIRNDVDWMKIIKGTSETSFQSKHFSNMHLADMGQQMAVDYLLGTTRATQLEVTMDDG